MTCCTVLDSPTTVYMVCVYYCSGFFKAGDYEAAINAFSQAISLNPMLPVYPAYMHSESINSHTLKYTLSPG